MEAPTTDKSDQEIPARDKRIEAALERFRKLFPNGDFGRRISKEEEENILGFESD